MNWLTSLFSSPRIVKQAIDLADDSIRGIGRWIDEQQLTEQERAEFRQKRLELYARFITQAATESTARTVTRRILAVMILSVFTLFVITGAVMGLIHPTGAEWLIRWVAATRFDLMALGVASFYFGVHLLRK